ncbi:MAG: NAD-dependent epimerase/dehydratase family protein [Deltaproteobacteria bacterium]|jgi:UDP-glucose 4-epimerase|nr:NAD-dependent epimerase/dehydratase family protein [Deltaproteobacteria bacterium]
MKISFKNALVTGGAGFIGSHLVEALVSGGCQVTVLDNLSTGSMANLEHLKGNYKLYREDIRDAAALLAAAEKCDVIFHLAAVVSVPLTIENPVEAAAVNDMGSLLVFETARQLRVKRVVFSSSCAIYGDDPRLPKREDMLPKPMSPYAVQKLTAEYYARVFNDLYGIETVALRYFNVYGPRQDPSSPYSGVISIFMTKALQNQAAVIYGDGDQSRDFIYVRDVVKANLLAATAPNACGKVINIGSARAIRINELWQAVCAVCGRNLDPIYERQRPGDIKESLAEIEKAKTILNFDCEVPLEAGIASTFEWYRQNQRSEDR